MTSTPRLAPIPTANAPISASTEVPELVPGSEHHRAIRSFVRRTGRTTVAQAKAFEDVGPTVLLSYAAAALSLPAAFGREAPTILEIGFGMGEATAHIAALMPDKNFLCCEVHTPGVGALLKRIAELDLRNIRILQHDAVEVIDHMLPLASLDGIHIFFPDPWHKKKHNKRRLIQPPLIARLAARLKPGGYLHCATDWQPYAEQILDVLAAEPLLQNSADDSGDGYAPKPAYRPLTKFENRGIKLGHGVWDVVFARVASSESPRPLAPSPSKNEPSASSDDHSPLAPSSTKREQPASSDNHSPLAPSPSGRGLG